MVAVACAVLHPAVGQLRQVLTSMTPQRCRHSCVPNLVQTQHDEEMLAASLNDMAVDDR